MEPTPVTVAILCAADDAYAKGLAVTVCSALKNLSQPHRLRLFLVDGGLSPSIRRSLEKSFDNERLSVEWIHPNKTEIQAYPTSDHISPTAYLRLFAAELLPDDLDRVIYLDSDLVVRDDLLHLWNATFDDTYCLAVQEPCSPLFNSSTLDNFKAQGPYILKLRPVENYFEAGLPDRQPYFNSGVLVIDLESWRRERLAQQFRNCLEAHSRYVWCWDQYVLNFVLAGHWKPLPHYWNVGAAVFDFPSWRESLMDRKTFLRARRDPSLVHFTTGIKPWHGVCPHPFREEFFEYLDLTAWCGWRPKPNLSSMFNWLKWRVQIGLVRFARHCDFHLATDIAGPQNG